MLREYIIDLSLYEKFGDQIGRGGFGKVFKIRDKLTKTKIYAAKVSIDKSVDQKSQIYIMSEIETGSKIKHPTILKFIGYNLYDFNRKSRPTIITEYMPRGSLMQLFNSVRRKNVPDNWNTKRYIISLGIVLAMKYLHSNKIVHRDLKPDNILIDDNYYPRICDFGFSRFKNEEFASFIMNSSIGTRFYAAPEIESQKYNYTVDIFSFGLTLFELITLVHSKVNVDLIKGQENKEFLSACTSENPFERPNFDEIYEFIQNDSFISLFGDVDQNEVEKFYDWFHKTEKQLNRKKSDTNEEEEEEEESNLNNNNNNNTFIRESSANEDEYEEEEDDLDEFYNDNFSNDNSIIVRDVNNVFYKLLLKREEAMIVEPERSLFVRNEIFIPTFYRYSSKNYTITRIRDRAFCDSHITSLTFSEDSKIQSIGKEVFKNSPISTFSIPAKLRKLDDDWCCGCDNLSQIEVHHKNKYFKIYGQGFLLHIYRKKNEYLFAPRDFEGDFIIDEGTTRIGNYCFSGREHIAGLISQAWSLEVIDSFAFYKCKNLLKIEIHFGQTLKLGNFCFAQSKKIQSAEFDCKDLEVGENCFENCVQLSSVLFKNAKKIKLNAKAFKNCSSLDLFVIRNVSEFNVGDECFKGLAKLNSIGFNADSVILSENFIQNCPLLSLVIIESKEDLTIPSVTFSGCNNIRIVKLSSSSTLKLNNQCFKRKSHLQTVDLSGKSVEISEECFDECSSLNHFQIIQSGNIKIDQNPFKECNEIESIKIESTIDMGPDINSKIELGRNCFSGFINLKSVEFIGGDIELKNQCFNSCSSLENLSILDAKNVTIDYEQFANFTSLQKIIINSDSKVDLDNKCFYGSDKIESVSISGKIISLKRSCFEKCSSLSTLAISQADIISLGPQAFYKCVNLVRDIDLSAVSTLVVADNCFNGTRLNEVVLQADDVTVGNEAFKNCMEITSVSLPSSNVARFEYSCFEGCKNIQTIDVRANQEISAGKNCFYQNEKLQSATFECVKVYFGEFCFNCCKELNEILVQEAKHITYCTNSFRNCPKNMLLRHNDNADINIYEPEQKHGICSIF